MDVALARPVEHHGFQLLRAVQTQEFMVYATTLAQTMQYAIGKVKEGFFFLAYKVKMVFVQPCFHFVEYQAQVVLPEQGGTGTHLFQSTTSG